MNATTDPGGTDCRVGFGWAPIGRKVNPISAITIMTVHKYIAFMLFSHCGRHHGCVASEVGDELMPAFASCFVCGVLPISKPKPMSNSQSVLPFTVLVSSVMRAPMPSRTYSANE